MEEGKTMRTDCSDVILRLSLKRPGKPWGRTHASMPYLIHLGDLPMISIYVNIISSY